MSVYDRLGDKAAPKQSGSWRGGRRGTGGPRRSRGGRSGQHWRGGVNPRTRIDDEESTQQYPSGFQRGNQRFPHRGRGRKRYVPYGRKQYSGGQEDDYFEDMGEDSEMPRGDIFSRLGGRDVDNSFQPSLDDGHTEDHDFDAWFKVTIPGAADNTSEWTSRIRSEINLPLEVHNLHVLGNRMMFFINGSDVAEALKEIDGKLQSESGPLRLFIKPSDRPQQSREGRGRGSPHYHGGMSQPSSRGLDDEITMKDVSSLKDTLKQALGTRYAPGEKSLNLSDMFNDATTNSSGIKVIMTKAQFVSLIIQLIAEHCPDLVTLNLSNNRIQYLGMYSQLVQAAPNIQALDLSRNNIRHLNELDHLSGCTQLKYLQVDNNPGVESFKDFASLVHGIRRRFPSLHHLNGQELAKPVKFGVPDSSSLPPPLPPVQGNYVINQEVQSLVTQFVKAYYEIYDSNNRDNLLHAYHDRACFSMSVRQPDPTSSGPYGHNMSSYLPISRNFLKLTDTVKRNNLAQSGRVDIVKTLKSLPRTSHILSSFTVDVLTASSDLTCLTLTGAFAEVSASLSVLSEYDVKNIPVRCFSRTFTVVPMSSGVIIANDQMTIWNPSVALDKKFRQELTLNFQQQQQQQQLVHNPANAIQFGGVGQQAHVGDRLGLPQFSGTSNLGQLSTTQLGSSSSDRLLNHPTLMGLPEERKLMVVKLLQVTGMNVKYSLLCLSQNDFNYDKSMESFHLLKKTLSKDHEIFIKDY